MQGAKLALAEAYRNVAASGASPVAVTDCLNFGSPENPEVMWQFSQAVEGLSDACLELEIPVTGGNVSFYNQTGDPDLPDARSSACSASSTMSPAASRAGWQDEGDNIYLSAPPAKSSTARPGPAPSTATSAVPAGGRPAGASLAEALHVASLEGLVSAAHDLSTC